MRDVSFTSEGVVVTVALRRRRRVCSTAHRRSAGLRSTGTSGAVIAPAPPAVSAGTATASADSTGSELDAWIDAVAVGSAAQ